MTAIRLDGIGPWTLAAYGIPRATLDSLGVSRQFDRGRCCWLIPRTALGIVEAWAAERGHELHITEGET